jgi:hypothetical protein
MLETQVAEDTSTSLETAATAGNLATAETSRTSTAVRTTESAGPTAQETTGTSRDADNINFGDLTPYLAYGRTLCSNYILICPR